MSISPATYPQFFWLARLWAWMVLLFSGFWPRAIWLQKPEKDKLYIICPNHTSVIDIMLTLALFRNSFLFIGKKELANLPLFGYFYKRTNLLVDRNSLKSRKTVFERAGVKMDQGFGLCIFPEGMVPDDTQVLLAPFKSGAFRLAASKGVEIIPVSYPDNKRRFSYDFWKGCPGSLRAIIHPFISAKDDSPESIEELQNQCYNIVRSGLEPDEIKSLANEIR